MKFYTKFMKSDNKAVRIAAKTPVAILVVPLFVVGIVAVAATVGAFTTVRDDAIPAISDLLKSVREGWFA